MHNTIGDIYALAVALAALVMVGKRKSSVPSPPPVVPPAPPSTRNKVAVYKGLDRVFPTHGVRVTRGVLDANDIKLARDSRGTRRASSTRSSASASSRRRAALTCRRRRRRIIGLGTARCSTL